MSNRKVRNKFIAVVFLEKWYWVLLMTLCLILTGSFRSWGADYIRTITDHIQENGREGLWILIGVCCLIQIVNYSTKFVSAYSCTYLTKYLMLKIRMELLKKLQRLPFREYEKHKAGEIQSVIRNDATKAADYVYMLFSRIGVSVFTAFFTILFMLAIHVEMTLCILIVTIVFGVINQRVLQNIKKNEQESRKMLGKITNVIVNTCETMDTVKAYRSNKYILRHFRGYREVYSRSLLNIKKINGYRLGFYTIVNNITLLGSAIYLSKLAIEGKFSLGNVLAYVTLATQMLIAVEMIFRWSASLVGSNAAWDRVAALLTPEDIGAESDRMIEPDQRNKSIQNLVLQHISYSYDGERPAVENVALHLEKGNIYGIAGSSGSGKTTLLKCIVGAYESDTAHIVADGIPISQEELASLYAFVPSDNPLFLGTILENLTMGDPQISQERCEKWAQKLGIAGWIDSLPGKYQYALEENGQNLSGGQRQSLCILRALVSERPVLVLDEPFASLDAEREAQLRVQLSKLKKEYMILLTSHRQGSLAECHTIYQM